MTTTSDTRTSSTRPDVAELISGPPEGPKRGRPRIKHKLAAKHSDRIHFAHLPMVVDGDDGGDDSRQMSLLDLCGPPMVSFRTLSNPATVLTISLWEPQPMIRTGYDQ